MYKALFMKLSLCPDKGIRLMTCMFQNLRGNNNLHISFVGGCLYSTTSRFSKSVQDKCKFKYAPYEHIGRRHTKRGSGAACDLFPTINLVLNELPKVA